MYPDLYPAYADSLDLLSGLRQTGRMIVHINETTERSAYAIVDDRLGLIGYIWSEGPKEVEPFNQKRVLKWFFGAELGQPMTRLAAKTMRAAAGRLAYITTPKDSGYHTDRERFFEYVPSPSDETSKVS